MLFENLVMWGGRPTLQSSAPDSLPYLRTGVLSRSIQKYANVFGETAPCGRASERGVLH